LTVHPYIGISQCAAHFSGETHQPARMTARSVQYSLLFSLARWLVPKMVKNGLKSSFVYRRSI
ncbi:hypothetical protein MUO74_06135, partial [Candidatus Bathyarchaeota archaeon]|nr:hypothetical protein [Candidatus Bathyarchaeota archaeon]